MTAAETVDALGWVTRAEAWNWFHGAPIRIVATIIGACVLRWLLHRIIARTVGAAIRREVTEEGRSTRVLVHATGWSLERHRQRLATLGTLLRSTVTLVVTLIATLTVMSLAGIPLAPLLASAGVGGVALGFGAQALVKDFLSGIFMIMEDQYGVGDVIDAATVVGTVEDVTLRITSLRDGNGVVWHIRNGEITRIGNRSQGSATTMVDFPIAYEADVDTALTCLRDVATEFGDDPTWQAALITRPEVLGLESIVGAEMTLRMLAKCKSGEEPAVQRELRLRGKAALDRAGILGPGAPAGPPGATS